MWILPQESTKGYRLTRDYKYNISEVAMDFTEITDNHCHSVETLDENGKNEFCDPAKISNEMGTDSESFYTDAASYWENIPPTVNGMLGGYAHISAADISGSDAFLRSIFQTANPPGHGRVADCGAGIGRISRHLLQKHFGKVDLVEQCQTFLEKAKDHFKGSPKIGEYICQGLQDFSPPANTYDIIWCQWVLGHLTDTDLTDFFTRMAGALKVNGVIVVKENVSSSGEVEKDDEDSSVTRPLPLLKRIISRAGLCITKDVKQKNFPKGLYEVRMMCLKPKVQQQSKNNTIDI
ncbi:N-terminal methyltransferase [Oratosquilla oratoria]|uniref:N-terminal methyltransferase n=1 Tax=Oratosquilla oratoria TaxID=337810 RepID=UPI003F76C1EC